MFIVNAYQQMNNKQQWIDWWFFTADEVLADEVPAVPSYISDRYKVGRMIGDGNFAVVRECVELSTGREYALKIINKGKCRGKVSSKWSFKSDLSF